MGIIGDTIFIVGVIPSISRVEILVMPQVMQVTHNTYVTIRRNKIEIPNRASHWYSLNII